MQHGLHIMLQRLVRSTVKTAPRPNLIFEVPVLRTGLAHHYLTVIFKDLGLDLTWMLEHQRFERHRAGDHCIANFFDAGWTETVGLAWETEWWRTSFVRLEKRTGRPVWTNRFTFGKPLVDGLKSFPRNIREAGNQPGALHSRQLAFFGLPAAKLVTKQRLSVSCVIKTQEQPSIIVARTGKGKAQNGQDSHKKAQKSQSEGYSAADS